MPLHQFSVYKRVIGKFASKITQVQILCMLNYDLQFASAPRALLKILCLKWEEASIL